jgi:nickel-dependent lactate racemase
MIKGYGSSGEKIDHNVVRNLLFQGLNQYSLDGKKVLVIIPDHTRSAPIPLFFKLLCEILAIETRQLDFLIALGTHPVLSDSEIELLIGMGARKRSELFPDVNIINHRWDIPDELDTVGVIPGHEIETLTGGLLTIGVPVRLNRRVIEYDQIIICGPVFPHEVAGFSGGNKYLVPGIAGPEIINLTHWLGALETNMQIIGVKNTAVRRVIDRSASMVQVPILCVAFCMKDSDLHGVFIGPTEDAWNEAADLSSKINVIKVQHAYQRILSLPAPRYQDMWTASKAMYKAEPIVADGGEIIIYAPHIKVISFSHQETILKLGYHVRICVELVPMKMVRRIQESGLVYPQEYREKSVNLSTLVITIQM